MIKRRRILVLLLAATLILPVGISAEEEVREIDIGEWFPYAFHGKQMYSSNLVANATRTDYKNGKFAVGNPMSEFGIALVPPRKNSTVRIEINGSKLIQKSKETHRLKRGRVVYNIYPSLKFDYDQLLKVRQTIPETVDFTVTINDEPPETQSLRVQVRPITECLFGWPNKDEPDGWADTKTMFAAYVNEDHPLIDKLLAGAVDFEGRPKTFAGYQGDKDAVYDEVASIWDLLKSQGYRYSDITKTSLAQRDDQEATQHVRLLSDSFKNKQANCVDGSVLFCSILEKIGLHTVIILKPGHMLMGFYLDDEQTEGYGLETTMLQTHSLEDAINRGTEQMIEADKAIEAAIKEGKSTDYDMIPIAEARKIGILPLRDVQGELIDVKDVAKQLPELGQRVKQTRINVVNNTGTSIRFYRVDDNGDAHDLLELQHGDSIFQESAVGEYWEVEVRGEYDGIEAPAVPGAVWTLFRDAATFQVNTNQLKLETDRDKSLRGLNTEVKKTNN